MLDLKITRLFYQEKELAQNIILQVLPGDKIIIMGPTGCGKTSLLKVMNLFNHNYQGEVFYHNKLIASYPPCELRREIIYLMQEPYLPEGKTEDVFSCTANFKCRKKTEFNDVALRELLNRFQLEEEILKKPVKQLSGGEKQRIALIQVLLLQPEILLLDEPSSALDGITSQLIAEWLLEQRDMTVIVVSHDHIWQRLFTRRWQFKQQQVLDIKGDEYARN